ncbi:F0F1 ATP synthase subunit delta [Rhodobacteraceae bacterium WD3A24]|nr:F0F1 ATP synthase subunit delta [Rhodobacteraceae bacterium WD3A24]
MSEPASISAGIAARYATALFELARDDKALDTLENDIAALDAALSESRDLRDLISSPVYSRAEQAAGIDGVAARMEVSTLTRHTLAVMAARRRLFALPHLLDALRASLAAEKGEVTAEVRAAKALTKAQSEQLAKVLKDRVGKDVKLNATVDESLIGGLVVQVGSKMIDTSIRSRLAALQNAMKEVG